ncbi:pyridoxal-phosphate dependent enzyme [Streptomyces boncukensis]|uniref:Pyridoxal-phosphate dependent enzyme n=1 Tax=Streptomyces boncukensis TaxID=2711219 RepID=A0A6G4X7T1_9ACTN|nr:pyridoxal-phosphate dependent enzyme [Streptomyces boncukensis]NGO73303.1 pyridoxal-phosphate dependent enzyme [Streptomyces boncukensis]
MNTTASAAPTALSTPADRWYVNREARSWSCPPAPTEEVRAFHAAQPGYAPTPLTECPSLAAELGVGRVFVKDESDRLGLPAFKVLGGSWAVHRLLRRQPVGTRLRLVTATDGNHGRAVARLARLHGQQAEVFLPDSAPRNAARVIAAEGARVRRVAGDYDTAVRAAMEAAERPGAVLLQDMAWPGYEEIPGWVVEGYGTLFAEIDDRLEAAGAGPVDLLTVPVGVGSLAQAAVTHYRSRAHGRPGPALLAVEPETAASLLASLHHGEPVTVPTGETAMAGLNCGTPSSSAWPTLRDGLDAAVAITEAASARAMRDLAALGVPSGPCGAAALAGVRTAHESGDGTLRGVADPSSTVVLLSTEGAAAAAARPSQEAG